MGRERPRGKATSTIIHFYNSVSVAQSEQVFKKSKEGITQIAVDGAKLVKKLASEYEGNFRFEYSPESFTGTEPEYALEVCNAVLEVLQPSAENNVIINLPVTVEMSLPQATASSVQTATLVLMEHWVPFPPMSSFQICSLTTVLRKS